MINIGLLIVFAVIGIGTGILYNIFVIKNYPGKIKKAGYVKTVIVFFLIAMAFFGILSARSIVHSAINTQTGMLEQYIKDTYPNNGFVRNGLDLKTISGDASQTGKAVSEIRALLPTHTELGIDKIFYDLGVDAAMNQLQKRLSILDSTAKTALSYSDENNVLTVSSITEGVRTNAINLVNIILLVLSAIFAVLFLIYVITSLITALKARKEKQEETSVPAALTDSGGDLSGSVQ